MVDIKDNRSFINIVVTLPIIPFPEATGESRLPQVATSIETTIGKRNKSASWNYGLEPSSTFENYVVSENNELAYKTASFVANSFPEDIEGPLYITGQVGTGTSHLLHAVGHRIKGLRADIRVRIVQAYRYIDDCIASIRTGEQAKFLKAYQDDVDVLLIDNIENLGRGEVIQEQFKRLLDHFNQKGKLLAVASDKRPTFIKGLDCKIIARFEQGLIAAIKDPDRETMMAVLNYKQRAFNLELDPETREFIIDESMSSVSQLYGSLRRLVLAANLKDRKITLALAREVLLA